METLEVIVPATKKISIDGQRYEVAADTPVPVVDAQPLPKQKNRHHKFACPVCGASGRTSPKFRAVFEAAVCTGAGAHEDNPAFFEWAQEADEAE